MTTDSLPVKIDEINNFFGDMDLFLMDQILKGMIPKNAHVLDAGCGEGRNGIYFIKEGFNYTGIDKNKSKLKLFSYLSGCFESNKARFLVADLKKLPVPDQSFDLIICSQVLHFANDEKTFLKFWSELKRVLKPQGLVYVAVDSAIKNDLAVHQGEGKYKFPDGKMRFALTEPLLTEMKKGFREIEPAKTVIHGDMRAQSFLFMEALA